MKSFKEISTSNIIIVMNEVIQSGQCKNRGEFAKKIGEYQQNLSAIESGKRAPTVEQLAKAASEFGYNLNWMILGIGPKRSDPKLNIPIEQRVSLLEQQMRSMKKQMVK